jgi:hypothetical protein
VQPVFDKHCVDCHDDGTPGGKVLNLADDLNLLFNTSYTELRRKGYVRVVGAGPADVQPPLSWGSHVSPLVRVLLEGHGDPEIDRHVTLSDEELDRVITWVDINAPYYAHYASAYRDNRYGRSPLTNAELARLHELTGMVGDEWSFTDVNLTRPQHSPCLRAEDVPSTSGEDTSTHRPSRLTTEQRDEALAIIRAGGARLAERPRADMAGFRLVSPLEIRQQERYDALLQIERAMREAIARGQKRPHPAAPCRSEE